MVNRNYARGRVKEYEAIKILNKRGYNAVRTAGSHSPSDVIGWNNLQFIYLQIKRIKTGNKFYPDPIELTTFKDMRTPVNSSKWVWVHFDQRKRGTNKWEEIRVD